MATSFKVSVSSLKELRSVIHVVTRQHVQLLLVNGPLAAEPTDDKRTMKLLNSRLSEFLDKVRHLERSNQDLETQIKKIVSIKGHTTDLDWDVIQKRMYELQTQVLEMAIKNAEFLMKIDNNTLKNEDLKYKLLIEQSISQGIELDLAKLHKVIEEIKGKNQNLKSEIELTQKKFKTIKDTHLSEMALLKEKIKSLDVTVEVDASQSELSSTIQTIRNHYQEAVRKNHKEIDEWYKKQFKDIEGKVARNVESVLTGKTQLTELRKKKKLLEIDIQSMKSKIHSVKETFKDADGNSRQEISLNYILKQRQLEVEQVQDMVKHQDEAYKFLLNVKMDLEAEIMKYRTLLEQVHESQKQQLKC